MSVAIISDEMRKIPSSCSRCGFTFMYGPEAICAGYFCRVDNETDSPRPDWCPLQEVEPTRYAEWLYVDEYDDLRRCSECDHVVKAKNISQYCPHCGAKMDGGAE